MQRAEGTGGAKLEPARDDGARTPSDVATLLVELGRVAKGRQFYPPGHPLLGELFDRGLRAFQAELSRHGPLELEIRGGSFWLPDAGVAVGRGRLDDLAREFVVRAVKRLRFDASIDGESFRALIETLTVEREALEAAGGFERTLYTSARQGVQVNQVDYAALLARGEVAAAAAAAHDATEGDGDSLELECAGEAFAPGGTGLAGVHGTHEAGGMGLGDDLDEGAPGSGTDPLAALAGALSGKEAPEASLERAPLEAHAGSDRAAELVALLRELDECREDGAHAELVKQVRERAAALSDEGLVDEGYRAILVLASQASDPARSASQREAATGTLRELARGPRYRDLIARACAPGAAASIRAAQVLLQLGAAIVPTLLADIEREPDSDRRGQMIGILIAMGEKATPEIVASMESAEPRRVRLAVRLAGEIQNPAAVPGLQKLLRGGTAELRKEAAKSLVKIGHPSAVEALVDALASPLEDVPSVAAFCLGVTGSPRALEALLAALRRAMRTGEEDLARETLRALGRLGRAEAVPEIAGVLERRSLFGRRRLRELKLAAATALARLPGTHAHEALERAAESRDPKLREIAIQALGRRVAEATSA